MGRRWDDWRRRGLVTKVGSAVVLPIVIGVILIIIGQAVRGNGDDSSNAAAPPAGRAESLEVVDVAVVLATITETVDPASGPTKERDARASALDIAVRNTGDAVSFVDRIELEVLDRIDLESCVPSGGAVTISGSYSVVVGPDDTKGSKIREVLRQTVDPNSVDRFQVTVGTPPRDFPEPGTLVQLRVLLYHDDVPEPLDAGTVVVAAAPIKDDAVDPSMLFEPTCANENLARLAPVADWEGARSVGLEKRLAELVPDDDD